MSSAENQKSKKGNGRKRRAMDLSGRSAVTPFQVDDASGPLRLGEREQPHIDEMSLDDLAVVSEYDVHTLDNWTLRITRYEPKPQKFNQPLAGQPILIVHGFSENNSAWTSGDFLKILVYFGADLHMLELRGHGKSSVKYQIERYEEGVGKLPSDLEYGWDLDSYFMFDVPAAVDAVKRKTGRQRISYIGHSLGGMLGYGYAGLRDDLSGLITIGSPSDLGRGWPILRLMAFLEPGLFIADIAYGVRNMVERTNWAGKALAARLSEKSELFRKRFGERGRPPDPRRIKFTKVHISKAGEFISWIMETQGGPVLSRMFRLFPAVWNPAKVELDAIRAYFHESGEDEPRKVVEQFARWIRSDEMVCYKMSYDFKRGYKGITIPLAIIFGDQDRLTRLNSTRSVYRNAQSEYLLLRPVRGNSHIEITMGHDLMQICYDIKSLIEYSLKQDRQRTRSPENVEMLRRTKRTSA